MMGSGAPATRVQSLRYYLYDSSTGKFTEIVDGDVIGRKECSRPELSVLSDPDDRLLSRRHCTFSVRGSTLYIEDFGSTNPTRVNSVPIRARFARKLHIGDVIDIGSRRLILTHQASHSPGTASEQTVEIRSSALLQDEKSNSGTVVVAEILKKGRRAAAARRLRQSHWLSALLWISFMLLASFILLTWISAE